MLSAVALRLIFGRAAHLKGLSTSERLTAVVAGIYEATTRVTLERSRYPKSRWTSEKHDIRIAYYYIDIAKEADAMRPKSS